MYELKFNKKQYIAAYKQALKSYNKNANKNSNQSSTVEDADTFFNDCKSEAACFEKVQRLFIGNKNSHFNKIFNQELNRKALLSSSYYLFEKNVWQFWQRVFSNELYLQELQTILLDYDNKEGENAKRLIEQFPEEERFSTWFFTIVNCYTGREINEFFFNQYKNLMSPALGAYFKALISKSFRWISYKILSSKEEERLIANGHKVQRVQRDTEEVWVEDKTAIEAIKADFIQFPKDAREIIESQYQSDADFQFTDDIDIIIESAIHEAKNRIRKQDEKIRAEKVQQALQGKIFVLNQREFNKFKSEIEGLRLSEENIKNEYFASFFKILNNPDLDLRVLKIESPLSDWLSERQIIELFDMLAHQPNLRRIEFAKMRNLNDKCIVHFSNLLAKNSYPKLNQLRLDYSPNTLNMGLLALKESIINHQPALKLYKDYWEVEVDRKAEEIPKSPATDNNPLPQWITNIQRLLQVVVSQYKERVSKSWWWNRWFGIFHGGKKSKKSYEMLERLSEVNHSPEFVLRQLIQYIESAHKTSGMKDENSLAVILLEEFRKSQIEVLQEKNSSQESLASTEISSERNSVEVNVMEAAISSPITIKEEEPIESAEIEIKSSDSEESNESKRNHKLPIKRAEKIEDLKKLQTKLSLLMGPSVSVANKEASYTSRSVFNGRH